MSSLEDPLEEYTGLSLFSRTLGSLPKLPYPCNTDDPLLLHDFLKSLPVKNPDKLVTVGKNILDKSKSEVSNPEIMTSDETLPRQKEVAVEEDLESTRCKRSRFSMLSNSSQPSQDLFDKVKHLNDPFNSFRRLLIEQKETDKQMGRVSQAQHQFSKSYVPQRRRPGTPGRKRSQFKLLTNSSQPSQDLYPTVNFDKLKDLKDPAEYFKAFERLLMAQKEIDKQAGRVSQKQHQFSTSLAPRPRRPEIPGRKRTVKYRHLYPLVSSQEAILDQDSQQETACGDIAPQESEMENFVPLEGEQGNLELEEAAVNDPMLKAETGYDTFLDKLLASDPEELKGDGALNLIKDHLQITPLNIEKLNLPELLNPHLKASGGIMQNTRRSLSDVQNMIKLTSSQTPLIEKTADNSIRTLGSPTPKSPFASLLLLKKHILHSNPRSDPFSAVGIDQLQAQRASFSEIRSLSSNLVNADKDLSSSHNIKTQRIEEDDDANGNTSYPEIATGSVAHPYDKSVNDDLTALGSHNDDAFDDLSGVLEGNSIDMDNNILDEHMNQSDADIDVLIYKSNGPENAVEDGMQQEAVVSVQPGSIIVGLSTIKSSDIQNQFDQSSATHIKDYANDRPPETRDHDPGNCQDVVSEQPNEKIKEPSTVSVNRRTKKDLHPRKTKKNTNLSRRQSIAEKSSPGPDCSMDGCNKTQDSDSGKCQDAASQFPNENINKPASLSMIKQIKGQSHQCYQRETRAISRRQSLAASGTSWKNGVRRSTRMRSRPLEYWKGERFLYGRIHESLATVIGIKYESPGGAAGKPTLKVKSFVSEEYKDLVELAALH